MKWRSRRAARSFGTRVPLMHLIGGLLVNLPCGLGPFR
jgi:hypothetical protein